MADFYYIENDKLFKIAPLRSERLSRAKPIVNQLCLPRKFRFHILSQVHDILGNFSYGRLFPTLNTQYYWPQMALTIKEYIKTCDTCQKTKIPTKTPSYQLYPHKIATRPFQTYHIDFKTLTKRTGAGNTCILVIVCAFSDLTFLIPAPVSTALTTAKLLVREIVGRYSTPTFITFYKGQKFVSHLFGYIAKILGITRVTLGAVSAKSNGRAEEVVKRLLEGLKRFATPDIDDTHIEDILPLIELSLKTTSSKNMQITTLEIIHAFEAPLPSPLTTEDIYFSNENAQKYAMWSRNAIKIWHPTVYENLRESKEEMKRCYDKYNKVHSELFTVGDKVLMINKRIPAHSTRVLTRQKFRTILDDT